MKKYLVILALLLTWCATCLAADNPATFEIKFLNVDGVPIGGNVSWIWQDSAGQAVKYDADANGVMMVVFLKAEVYHAADKLMINDMAYSLANNEFRDTDMRQDMGKHLQLFVMVAIDESAKTVSIKDIRAINKDEAASESVKSAKYVDHLLAADQTYGFAAIPSVAPWPLIKVDKLPAFDLQKDVFHQGDLRHKNLTGLDLSDRILDLRYASFDNQTQWPTLLPKGFSPQRMIEVGKNPGLNVRKLHDAGITGKGVNIAIIDQTLLLNHEEYSGRVKRYEEMHNWDESAAMHGAAVTSLAIGKTIGTAPGASLFFVATTTGNIDAAGQFEMDLSYYAQAIEHLITVNKQLPVNEKIRVISISCGIAPELKGYRQMLDAVAHAKKEGIFVITCWYQNGYDYALAGCSRKLFSSPDNIDSISTSIVHWESKNAWREFATEKMPWDKLVGRMLIVPVDYRTYAEFTGTSDYAFDSIGGISWSAPWLAGMYALCCQVKPSITPDEFIDKALATGDTITVEENGRSYQLSKVINPQKLIAALKK